MICPHCGKSTRKAEQCEHCKKPTEFVRRSNIRPERIPGMVETVQVPVHAVHKGAGVKNMLLLMAVVIALLSTMFSVFFYLKYCHVMDEYQQLQQMLSEQKYPEMAEEEITETEEETVATEPMGQFGILLFRNYPDSVAENDYLRTIPFGEELPILPDTDEYHFCGWNTAADGSGTLYGVGEFYQPDVFPVFEDLLLYAQWEKFESIQNTEILARETENGGMESFLEDREKVNSVGDNVEEKNQEERNLDISAATQGETLAETTSYERE